MGSNPGLAGREACVLASNMHDELHVASLLTQPCMCKLGAHWSWPRYDPKCQQFFKATVTKRSNRSDI